MLQNIVKLSSDLDFISGNLILYLHICICMEVILASEKNIAALNSYQMNNIGVYLFTFHVPFHSHTEGYVVIHYLFTYLFSFARYNTNRKKTDN